MQLLFFTKTEQIDGEAVRILTAIPHLIVMGTWLVEFWLGIQLFYSTTFSPKFKSK